MDLILVKRVSETDSLYEPIFSEFSLLQVLYKLTRRTAIAKSERTIRAIARSL